MTANHDEAHLRLIAGRAKAAEQQPYLSTALYAIKPIREPKAPTLGVDKQWRLYWNPDFIASLSVDECAGAWLHEVGHLLREHSARFEALLEPQNRHPLWNRAGDTLINADLRDAGVVLPAIKACFPEQIPGASRDMATEQIYRLLLDSPEADKITSQQADLVLVPQAVVAGKTNGQKIIGLTRTPFLDANDFTVTVTDPDGAPVAVADDLVFDKRTAAFLFDTDLAAGEYDVTFTSNGHTATAVLYVIAPSIRLQPDHITRGWTAPTKVVVAGSHTDFTHDTVVTIRSADTDAPVTVTATKHISAVYVSVEITEQVPDGLYRVIATNPDGTSVEATLPIGLPFLDIFPASLPVGHGTPYPFAAVTDDLPLGPNTVLDMHVLTPTGPAPVPANTITGLTVNDTRSGEFTLNDSLDEGEYAVLVTNPDGEKAYAILTVAPPQPGLGEGSGEGEADDNSDGNGQGNSDGEPMDDCGSGAGGGPRPWDRGDDTSDGSVDTGRGNLIREQVAREIAEHAKTRGNIPGGWARWAEGILKPQVDWRKELRSVVRRTCATVAGMRDYTYQKPSRRASVIRDVVLPSMRAPRPPKVRVVLDTSGSVSDKMLAQALSEMRDIIKRVSASGAEGLELINCDAAATETQTVRDIGQVNLSGGGGTDMRVGIQAAAERTPRADLILTMTDGETPWPSEPPAENPNAKYVAVLLAGEDAASSVPSWMHTIVVQPESMTGPRG